MEASRTRMPCSLLHEVPLHMCTCTAHAILLSLRRGGLLGSASGGGGAVQVDARGSQLLELARRSLPFELTEGQKGALEDILAQMAGWPPMQCLLQVCVCVHACLPVCVPASPPSRSGS